jgi:hypothetical protein
MYSGRDDSWGRGNIRECRTEKSQDLECRMRLEIFGGRP